jgi:hypothetical protein
MGVNQDLIRAALQGQDIVPYLASEARAAWSAALTASLVHPRALAYADHLESVELPKAEEEAAPFLAAVDEAKQALAEEQRSIAAKSAAFWQSPKRADPDDRERPPSTESPRVMELKAAVGRAEQPAAPHKNKIRIIRQQIDRLRAEPRPDCVVLERLGLGVNEPCPTQG